MVSVDFYRIKREFRKFVAVSTTWSTGFLFRYIRSMAIFLLNIVLSECMVVQNLSGGIAWVASFTCCRDFLGKFQYLDVGLFRFGTSGEMKQFNARAMHELSVNLLKFGFFITCGKRNVFL